DLGAEIVRVERAAVTADPPSHHHGLRGRRSIVVDLKHPRGPQIVLDLAADADVLIEGYRPGVMERLGLGPEVFAARNPRLIYARMTGYGQGGPMAQAAGHDINYISLAG